MVYKKFIVRNGRKYGPYLYESHRDKSGKVINSYVSKENVKGKVKKSFSGLSMHGLYWVVVLLLLVAGVFYVLGTFKLIGHVISNIDSQYSTGENLSGTVSFVLKSGEFIPADSVVALQLNNISKSAVLSGLVGETPVYGNFSAEGTALNGSGEGYGGENLSLSVDISKFDIGAEDGALYVRLVYGDIEIASAEQEINVQSDKSSEVNESGSILNKTLINEFPGNLTNPTVFNVALEQNASINGTNVSITTIKMGQIVVGRPVRWKKIVEVGAPDTNVTIELPSSAENVDVVKVNEQTGNVEEVHPAITGLAISEGSVKGILSRIWDFFRGLFGGGFTGRVISEETIVNESSPVEVTLADNATQYEIAYETPAPQAFEENTSYGKMVTISAPDELNYTDVLAFSELPKESKPGTVRLYHIVNGTREAAAFSEQDLDANGLVDYIEWIVPHLSEQTFEIILISKAEHLDENRTFVEDAYLEVSARDDVWKEIPDLHYIRVTFRQNLTSDKDITIYELSLMIRNTRFTLQI